MASSKVMVSSSPANPDLPRHSSSTHSLTLPDLHTDPTKNFPSINMHDLFKDIYSDDPDALSATVDDGLTSQGRSFSLPKNRGPNLTLEDFMVKAGAVTAPAPAPEYDVDSIIGVPQLQAPMSGPGGFGLDSVGESCRVKRRAVEELPVDRATQQKQKRMIKNRESAARSREQKQAYTVELESLVSKLEKENARLMREEEELTRERYNQSCS